ncbi:hypothetical protein HDU97_010012 [Phlyctochytrium planicorne]|nr:hypothetical protein HDU97_010012 [Phlyctochytrium planicorne]
MALKRVNITVEVHCILVHKSPVGTIFEKTLFSEKKRLTDAVTSSTEHCKSPNPLHSIIFTILSYSPPLVQDGYRRELPFTFSFGARALPPSLLLPDSVSHPAIVPPSSDVVAKDPIDGGLCPGVHWKVVAYVTPFIALAPAPAPSLFLSPMTSGLVSMGRSGNSSAMTAAIALANKKPLVKTSVNLNVGYSYRNAKNAASGQATSSYPAGQSLLTSSLQAGDQDLLELTSSSPFPMKALSSETFAFPSSRKSPQSAKQSSTSNPSSNSSIESTRHTLSPLSQEIGVAATAPPVNIYESSEDSGSNAESTLAPSPVPAPCHTIASSIYSQSTKRTATEVTTPTGPGTVKIVSTTPHEEDSMITVKLNIHRDAVASERSKESQPILSSSSSSLFGKRPLSIHGESRSSLTASIREVLADQQNSSTGTTLDIVVHQLVKFQKPGNKITTLRKCVVGGIKGLKLKPTVGSAVAPSNSSIYASSITSNLPDDESAWMSLDVVVPMIGRIADSNEKASTASPAIPSTDAFASNSALSMRSVRSIGSNSSTSTVRASKVPPGRKSSVMDFIMSPFSSPSSAPVTRIRDTDAEIEAANPSEEADDDFEDNASMSRSRQFSSTSSVASSTSTARPMVANTTGHFDLLSRQGVQVGDLVTHCLQLAPSTPEVVSFVNHVAVVVSYVANVRVRRQRRKGGLVEVEEEVYGDDISSIQVEDVEEALEPEPEVSGSIGPSWWKGWTKKTISSTKLTASPAEDQKKVVKLPSSPLGLFGKKKKIEEVVKIPFFIGSPELPGMVQQDPTPVPSLRATPSLVRIRSTLSLANKKSSLSISNFSTSPSRLPKSASSLSAALMHGNARPIPIATTYVDKYSGSLSATPPLPASFMAGRSSSPSIPHLHPIPSSSALLSTSVNSTSAISLLSASPSRFACAPTTMTQPDVLAPLLTATLDDISLAVKNLQSLMPSDRVSSGMAEEPEPDIWSIQHVGLHVTTLFDLVETFDAFISKTFVQTWGGSNSVTSPTSGVTASIPVEATYQQQQPQRKGSFLFQSSSSSASLSAAFSPFQTRANSSQSLVGSIGKSTFGIFSSSPADAALSMMMMAQRGYGAITGDLGHHSNLLLPPAPSHVQTPGQQGVPWPRYLEPFNHVALEMEILMGVTGLDRCLSWADEKDDEEVEVDVGKDVGAGSNAESNRDSVSTLGGPSKVDGTTLAASEAAAAAKQAAELTANLPPLNSAELISRAISYLEGVRGVILAWTSSRGAPRFNSSNDATSPSPSTIAWNNALDRLVLKRNTFAVTLSDILAGLELKHPELFAEDEDDLDGEDESEFLEMVGGGKGVKEGAGGLPGFKGHGVEGFDMVNAQAGFVRS